MRRRLEQFMRGRYGTDEFSRFLLTFCLALLVLNLFARAEIVYLLALLVLGYCYFRMLSRNIAARSAENRKYLGYTDGIRRSLGKMKRRISESKEYHIYKCPSCGQKIRIPRGKGKIRITCPKCRNEFDKKS